MRRHLSNIHLLNVRWCTMATRITSSSTSRILLILRKLFLHSRFNQSAKLLRPRRMQVLLNKDTSLEINNLCVRLQTRGVVLTTQPPIPQQLLQVSSNVHPHRNLLSNNPRSQAQIQ